MHPEPNGRRGIRLALEKRVERHERGHEEEKKSVPTKEGREPPTWMRADAQTERNKIREKKNSNNTHTRIYTQNRYIHIDINHLHRYHKH